MICIYIYIYAFSRRFYPKRLTMHSGYAYFSQYLRSLGIEPTTFALLTQCSPTDPQEHCVMCYCVYLCGVSVTRQRRRNLLFLVRTRRLTLPDDVLVRADALRHWDTTQSEQKRLSVCKSLSRGAQTHVSKCGSTVSGRAAREPPAPAARWWRPAPADRWSSSLKEPPAGKPATCRCLSQLPERWEAVHYYMLTSVGGDALQVTPVT